MAKLQSMAAPNEGKLPKSMARNGKAEAEVEAVKCFQPRKKRFAYPRKSVIKADLRPGPNTNTVSRKHFARRRRTRRGASALKEIRRFDKGASLLLPFTPMKRFCQNVALKLDKKIRLKRAALYAFQGAAETFLVDFFSACNDARNHAKRLTLQVKDMNMVWTLDSAMAGK